ncbi:hypothetical protein GH714_011546 [Hevea brasiliensis]|uniref:CNNM transmembrane domain-containing protein n=1 Tax=Hevea brasiliensis TaxID=3981 RepID=A0A6A6MMX4_HEVBR|nr:hypothetical protein GH714_011546 [Hevea brasiliensis]
MAIACESSILGRSLFVSGTKSSRLFHYNRFSKITAKVSPNNYLFLSRISSNFANSYGLRPPCISASPRFVVSDGIAHSKSRNKVNADLGIKENAAKFVNLELIRFWSNAGSFWVHELAEKESDDGVFKMLRSDVTRFLIAILIGTTVVNIGATALVTDAATAIFGEAGVSAATGVMTVAILLLTEMTPKSIAVHSATEIARFVGRPVAWLSVVLYPSGKSRHLPVNGNSKDTWFKWKKDMIENVLGIKDTHVREAMTPLVDVVAIDASATLVDFHELWVTHQYSRVPVFEQRVDNIVEEIQKKTGYILMRAEEMDDVDANTSIDQLSEDLNIKMPEAQYETVSGFICEAFGYIPRTGESIKVILEKGNQEEDDEQTEGKSE